MILLLLFTLMTSPCVLLVNTATTLTILLSVLMHRLSGFARGRERLWYKFMVGAGITLASAGALTALNMVANSPCSHSCSCQSR